MDVVEFVEEQKLALELFARQHTVKTPRKKAMDLGHSDWHTRFVLWLQREIR